MKCIQCGSQGCGWDVCRFSGRSHAEYQSVKNVTDAYAKAQAERDAINAYANAMAKCDQAARCKGRPEHDMSCSGMPLKAGT